jgi:hypothetical protein
MFVSWFGQVWRGFLASETTACRSWNPEDAAFLRRNGDALSLDQRRRRLAKIGEEEVETRVAIFRPILGSSSNIIQRI